MSFYQHKYEVFARGALNEHATFTNGALSLGARLKYRRIGVSLAVPVLRTNLHEVGNQQNFVLRINGFPSKFLLESSIRYAKGFEVVFNNAPDQPFFDEAMRMWQGDVAISYPLNSQKFSLRSSFRFMDRQLKSRGTVLLTATGNYQKLYTESDLTSFARLNGSDLRRHNVVGLGLGFGYGYTYVKKSFFITAVTSANLGGQRISLLYQERTTDWALRPDIAFRLACGFNADKYFVGLHGYHRFNLIGPNIYRSRFESFNVGLTVGMRIKAPKILQQVNGTINGLLAIPKRALSKNN